jgi:hypothetical protein
MLPTVIRAIAPSPEPIVAQTVRCALIGYQCSVCGCMFPETPAPRGRTSAETRLLEKIHVQREFAQHICAKRGW